jgi:hypothetical protein
MIYKLILFITFFIQTISIYAQSDFKDFKFEIEHPDGHIELDSIPNLQPGKKATRCLVQDRYELQPNADTTGYAQRRQWSWEYLSPKFDSVVEKVEIRPAYSFYEVNRKAKLPRKAKIIPAIWDYRVSKDTFLKQKDWYLMRVMNDNDVEKSENCIVMKLFESIPIVYKTYQCFLKTPAILVQNINNQWITDTLKNNSPYLKWTHVPARYVTRTRFVLKTKPRFVIRTTSDSLFKSNQNNIFGRTGGFTEWRERVVIRCFYDTPLDMIAQIQKALRKRCFRVKVTNIFDAETKKVLIQFQKKHHLILGNLDNETLTKLGLPRYMPERQVLDYHSETYPTHFKYNSIDDFKDASQITFLKDIELAQLMETSIKKLRQLRKISKR